MHETGCHQVITAVFGIVDNVFQGVHLENGILRVNDFDGGLPLMKFDVMHLQGHQD